MVDQTGGRRRSTGPADCEEFEEADEIKSVESRLCHFAPTGIKERSIWEYMGRVLNTVTAEPGRYLCSSVATRNGNSQPPESYNCVEKIEQLNGTLIDSQIIKYFEGFGWGHGRIKSFNAKWKYPFTIKWVDEPHPRKHLLRVEEYTSMERISYPKPGDFMILSKESKEG